MVVIPPYCSRCGAKRQNHYGFDVIFSGYDNVEKTTCSLCDDCASEILPLFTFYFNHIKQLVSKDLELTHKGFKGTVKYSKEDGVYYGKVLGVNALILYEGKTVQDLIDDFYAAVDTYIEETSK